MSKLEQLIELLVEQEFKTKLGNEIDFRIHERSPRHRDQLGRGWVVHRIEAIIDGEEVGYINISYIPEERFNQQFHSILQYIDKMKGKGLSPGKDYNCPHPCSDHLDDLPLAGQVRAIAGLSYSTMNMFYQSPSKPKVIQPEEMSDSELRKLKDEMIADLKERYGHQFEKFKEFHVNKPLVGYIEVYEPRKRQRIGAALYEKAARWLAETKGLKLYASGIQTDKAKAAWNWLRKNKGAQIGTEVFRDGDRSKVRTYLSYL